VATTTDKGTRESEELLRKDPKRRLDAPDAMAMDTLPRLASLQNLLNQQNYQKMLLQKHQARGILVCQCNSFNLNLLLNISFNSN